MKWRICLNVGIVILKEQGMVSIFLLSEFVFQHWNGISWSLYCLPFLFGEVKLNKGLYETSNISFVLRNCINI